ncbi:Hypothetical Protein FCC1311_003952 [Hondaea fermentalgiana]|uniref:NadR/Ttd14 AAA domain-containing protein n=1 Tax=Hondaea fermentalgiana TaxID=2315210 RepID=A0A2R5FZJ2_9STRA|nr:Hypothetical Protein FCC1311_003952 [Hondaea fermentalgiana]|eukprot:GBG24177.1 Hypothetical Protein FCC1311_003952 [Hondaea fermentalgiana]
MVGVGSQVDRGLLSGARNLRLGSGFQAVTIMSGDLLYESSPTLHLWRCGKTELCRRFESEGFRTLDEAFLDMPSYGLHPQSLLMETTWVCSWFERLLKYAQGFKERGESHERVVFFADRSPMSAVFYSSHGELLTPIINKQMEEVRKFADINIHTVHVRVQREILWRRVQARLELEPDRVLYKEDQRDWMDQVVSFYETFAWDTEIDNSEEDVTMSLQKLVDHTVRTICSSLPGLDVCIRDATPHLYKRAGTEAAMSDDDEHADSGDDAMCSIDLRSSAIPHLAVPSPRLAGSRRVQAAPPLIN